MQNNKIRMRIRLSVLFIEILLGTLFCMFLVLKEVPMEKSLEYTVFFLIPIEFTRQFDGFYKLWQKLSKKSTKTA